MKFGRSAENLASRQAGRPAGKLPRAGPGARLGPLSPRWASIAAVTTRVTRGLERLQHFYRSRAAFQPVVASGQAGGHAGPLPRAGPGVTLEPRSPAGRPWETGAPSALWVSADLRPISSSLSSLPARRRGPRGHCPELGLVCGRGLSLHAGRPLRPKHPG